MNTIKTIILFIILAILAGYVYFYEIEGGVEREKAEEIAQKIIPVEKDSVKKIEIRSVFNRFFFERVGNAWLIKKPVETEGDKSTIEGLINTFKDMKKVRQFSIKNGEQKDYGLVGRSTLVIFEFNNGTRDSVRIGDDTPVGGNIFVSRGDSIVYTVASQIKTDINKSLFDWRDKSVAKISLTNVKEFKLKNNKGMFYLKKQGSDWQIEQPRTTRADDSVVDALLRKFETGKINSVISESFDKPGEYDLKNPTYTLDMYLGEGMAHKQIILSRLNNNISHVKDDSRPQVMTVDSLFIKDIDKSFFQLRYKNITEFDKNKADSITIFQGDSVLYFSKDSSGTWLLAGDKKVKDWKMNSFLNTLQNLQAKKFLLEDVKTTGKYGLNQPERTIACYTKGEKNLTILLSSYDESKVAFSKDARTVAEIEGYTYNNMEVKEKDFIDTPAESDGDNN